MFLIWFIVWFVIWMVFMAVAEYAIHRWTMHRKRGWLPKFVFEDHAIEHHHKERNDINIDLPVWHHLLIGSPLIISVVLLGSRQ